MPWVQRGDDGRVTGQFAWKQPGHAEEFLPDNSSELLFIADDVTSISERAWRDSALFAVAWLRDRHRDQLDIGADTTLTAGQFSELLMYMQQLRDWPQSEAFPTPEQRPVPPPWIADQTP